MRIALLGGPGSGKGTQAKMLSGVYRVPQISTGDLLRDAVAAESPHGMRAKEAMESGCLVDDEIVLSILEERFRMRDIKRGFIIDGYPRNIPQAQALDNLLGLLGRAIQIAVNIDVDNDILVKRISGRFSCKDCGAIYNRHYAPPKVENVCDQCGSSEFLSRADDNLESVKTRLEVYQNETSPLITYYRAQHKLRTVKGEGDKDEIHQKLRDIVDLEIRPLEMHTLETAAEVVQEVDGTIIAGGEINRLEARSKPDKPKRVRTKKSGGAKSGASARGKTRAGASTRKSSGSSSAAPAGRASRSRSTTAGSKRGASSRSGKSA